MLLEATVRSVEDNTLVLTHTAPTLAKRLGEPHNADLIREALKDALGVDWRVRCEIGAAPSAATEPRSAVPDAKHQQRHAEVAEDEMLAEAAETDNSAVPRRDPEEVALELLQNELGARKIDG